MTIHLIPNSHLDPVWLWDWREGLNEGVITCRTMVDLMDEFPDLTYIRGESVIYEHIQKTDPTLFEKIRAKIAQGRWEVVGGTFLQPDTNLPATEVLVRHFTAGLGYFERELRSRPKVAWAADSFGHSGGWPEIYAAAGIENFACSRPMEHDFALPKPAFWWEAASGARILSWRIPVGWYGTNRDEVFSRLDQTVAQSSKWGLENVAVFVGLGNHGGGPSRRQLEDIVAWAQANRGVAVEFSGLHRFFEALRHEAVDLPVVRGELNFTLRGCYSSAARFKTLYRKTENLLLSAEKTDSVISAACRVEPSDLGDAWRAVLFNTFHDILPGSSIERAFDDQFAWIGVGWHEARRAELSAVNTLASRIDTTVSAPAPDMPCGVPVVVWNPHPFEYDGPVEIEAGLDYRPITTYDGRANELPVEVLDAKDRPLPFQRLEPENYFTPKVPWRIRVAARLRVPAFGWHVVRMAWKDNPRLAVASANTASSKRDGSIENGFYRLRAQPGKQGIDISQDGAPLFGAPGLSVASYQDLYGSWGGHDGEREADSIEKIEEFWQIERVETLASGPQKASAWVRFASSSKRSRLDLTFSLYADDRRLHVSARLFCDEDGRRIKLILPLRRGEKEAVFEVPGGTQARGQCGETPGGRWVKTAGFVFASDALYNFDLFAGALNATLVRSCRYACSIPTEPDAMPHRPYMDGGEHRFQFALAPADADAFRLSDGLEQPLLTTIAAPHQGTWGRKGSLAALAPSQLRLLAFKPAEIRDGSWIIRVQETAGKTSAAVFTFQGEKISLGSVSAFQIATWKLTHHRRNGWLVEPVAADEKPVPAVSKERNGFKKIALKTPRRSRQANGKKLSPLA